MSERPIHSTVCYVITRPIRASRVGTAGVCRESEHWCFEGRMSAYPIYSLYAISSLVGFACLAPALQVCVGYRVTKSYTFCCKPSSSRGGCENLNNRKYENMNSPILYRPNMNNPVCEKMKIPI